MVGPDAELHLALLFVVRKVLDLDVTLTLVDGWRLPLHLARVFNGGLRHHCNDVVAVSTASYNMNNDHHHHHHHHHPIRFYSASAN